MLRLLVLTLCCLKALSLPKNQDLHPHPEIGAIKADDEEKSSKFWNDHATATLKKRIAQEENHNVAKNIIFFLGDGMSLPTITATRVFYLNENVQLSFDKFPHSAVSKTYCVDYQVPDSACTATAYLGGVKGNMGTIGVNGKVPYGDCQAMTNTSNHVQSIAQWALSKGKSAGLVTTARVTDASPAGVYGHTAQRDWETDTDINKSGNDPKICQDLATQLIKGDVGKQLKVIMGGGRTAFLPKEKKDEEGNDGERSDNVDLIEAWKTDKKDKKAEYISNKEQLKNLSKETEYVLGLFKSGHCPYYWELNNTVDPSLFEMTEAAIDILSKNPEGYFLFVEGARIDMAHHGAMAQLALSDTLQFSLAVQIAHDLTNENDTLIVVTSDHAHTMSMSGYPKRGHNIFEIVGNADDGLPFLTLNYANGPGYVKADEDGTRHDVSKDNLADIEYKFPGSFPLDSETHGGDDVIIFANGPYADLFTGVIEQNLIPHLIGYASCISKEGPTACDSKGDADDVNPSVVVFCAIILANLFL